MGGHGKSNNSKDALTLKMATLHERPLPSILTASDEFRALNPTQGKNFIARLRYIDEVVDSIRSFIGGRSEESMRDFLDNLELDASSAYGFSSNLAEHQSNYLVHSSWTFNCTAAQMAEVAGSELIRNRQIASLASANKVSVCGWLAEVSNALTLALARFYEASTYCVAIAHLIIVDALTAELLAGLTYTRLNSQLATES
jgi:hypothetical protein